MNNLIAKNKRNTFFMMALFVGVISALGWLLARIYGNVSFMIGMIGVSLIYVFVQYFFADKFALMASGAHETTELQNPRLYKIVKKIVAKTGIPMPRVYIINDPAPNAFATGRDPKHAVVAATSGILDLMDDRELEAVMAHEIGHVRNYDIRVSMITFGLVSVIGVLCDFAFRAFLFGGDDDEGLNPISLALGAVLIFLMPVIATLVQLAISRQREYLADATGAETTHDAEGLARALEKLKDGGQKPMLRQNTSTAHLFFANPLKPGVLAKLFSTHPPLEDRIARLRGSTAPQPKGKF